MKTKKLRNRASLIATTCGRALTTFTPCASRGTCPCGFSHPLTLTPADGLISFTRNLFLVFLMTSFLSGCGRQKSVAPPAAANATNAPGAAIAASATYQKLSGKWLRPDGDYILEIRSVAPNGKLDAAYFNPRSINIAKAEASQAAADLKVFIELRDVNYPGSTYTLTYEPGKDQLTGAYFQAVARETYDVSFVRTKP